MTAAKIIICVFIVISIARTQDVTRDTKTVTLEQGPVRGYRSEFGIYEFFGIPYASAPTGRFKYMAPSPPPTWTEVLDATNNSIICPQNPLLYPNLKIQEDCLIANVYTPDTNEINLPVVVIIHGGAYHKGFGHEFTPRRLVQTGNLIAVTFNYRLGAHGFLCLGTPDIPGNAGLKDQLALLKWVKSNIASFGGNPDDVTLSGYSAGSSSVDLLMISNVTRGLFNKVIPESSANVAQWSVQIDPINNAKKYARLLNFTDADIFVKLEEFYKTAPLEVLTSIPMSLMGQINGELYFSPCMEPDFGNEIILQDTPVNIIKNGSYNKVPILYGFANMEGLLRISDFDSWISKMNEKFSDFLPGDLEFSTDDEREYLAQRVKEFYFGNSSIGILTLFDYIDFFSDTMFVYPILRSAKLQIERGHNSIYMYEYNFYNKFPSVPGTPDVLVNFPGANHCAQTEAVLDETERMVPEENYTEEYRRVRAAMVDVWANFIKTGMPLSDRWPAADSNRSPYMSLGSDMELKTSLLAERAQFWDRIYDQYYRHPSPPEIPDTVNGGAIIISLYLLLVLSMIISIVV